MRSRYYAVENKMNAIKVNNLTKRYGDVTAVDNVSFTVKKGTMLGFLGVNGAGKTTVINMLATLLTPDEGNAEICGEVLGKKNAEIRKKIGIVYQQNCLDDLLSVQKNLLCRGVIHGATRKGALVQCEKLGQILKLDDIMKKKYKTLSGGQKRRCEIAAALMHTPEILFLDEPTTGLDPATRLDVWSTIEELQRTEKMTVFLTTHYMEEAAKADHIIIMDHGKIITEGTPFALKEKYAKDKVRLFYKKTWEQELTSRLENWQMESVGEICKKETGVLELMVASTLEALPLINRLQNFIDGFEVIQGNMDDVFLNAVDKEINEEGVR